MSVIITGVDVVLIEMQCKLTNKAIHWKLEYLSLNHFQIYQTSLFVTVTANAIAIVSVELFTRVSRKCRQTDVQNVPAVPQASLSSCVTNYFDTTRAVHSDNICEL
jgi:hypothetical protein